MFPSGRVQKRYFKPTRGSSRGGRGRVRGSFRGRGRGGFNQNRFGSQRTKEAQEVLYKKVKLADANGKEKYVMMAVNDHECEAIELADSNLAQGKCRSNLCDSYNTDNGNVSNNLVLKCVGDSAATEHIIQDPRWLYNVKSVTNGIIRSANKNSKANLKVERVGEMLLKDNLGRIIKLNRVLQTRDVSKNLISLRRLVNNGMKINLNNKSINVLENESNKKVLDGSFDGRLWNFDLKVINAKDSNLIQEKNNPLN